MAIFNMEDSSLNEYYLNEHGGARNKYVKMKEEEAEKAKKEFDNTPDYETKTEKKNVKLPFGYSVDVNKTRNVSNIDKKSQLAKKHHEALYNANKYAGTYKEGDNEGKNVTVVPSGSKARYTTKHIGSMAYKPSHYVKSAAYRSDKLRGHGTRPDYQELANSRKGKEQFNKDFGGKGNKRQYENDKIAWAKYNEKKDKWKLDHNKQVIKDRLKTKGKLKEAAEYIYSMIESAEYYENHDEANTSLKEAAEYILSVLDEMDYIEESEKKMKH